MGDGPKWLCDPYRLKPPSTPCVVYSVGSNNNFMFEEAIVEQIGKHCEVHTFDPGDPTGRWKSDPGGPQPQNFHKWGFAPNTVSALHSRDPNLMRTTGHPITSWDWKEGLSREAAFPGTRDFSAIMALPAAVEYV